MKLIGLGSVRGAPGVTTSAHLIAGALTGPTALVEADRSGGVMAVRYGLGREPGLTTFAAAGALRDDEWRQHAQDAGGVPVLVGPDAPDNARSLWVRAGERISRSLEASDATFVLDVGRLDDEPPLARQLSLLVILVRPVAEHLVTLSHLLPALRRSCRVALVLAGPGEYRRSDLESTFGVDVIGTLARDPRAAEALCGTAVGFAIGRSRLVRSASEVADALEAAVMWVPASSGSTS